jgi:undecaprenyl-diphosphatase
MSNSLLAVILGIIEGLTEFLPVSSTAHLLIAEQVLGFHAPGEVFPVVIQLGAILAVVALYFARLWAVVVGLPTKPEARRFAVSVLIAFLPAVILGLLLHDFIKTVMFESPALICWSLLIGGVVLLGIDRLAKKPRHFDSMQYPWLTSLGIGLFQCLSMVPGVSRSGATIVGGLLLGGDKRSAAEFSFFLAIPTMVGAFAYDLYKSRDQLSVDDAGLIAIGFVVSFVSGLVVIKAMLSFVAKHGFAPFAWWRILVGGGGLLLLTFAG